MYINETVKQMISLKMKGTSYYSPVKKREQIKLFQSKDKEKKGCIHEERDE